MHKSAIIFGFFLASSLMVLATTNFVNMNFFSKAMAMEMNPYMNNDNSHRYANYETYSANYYQQPNYYYSQDRQYEDKQNSYSTDYNDNYKNYNKYPTEDKKYVLCLSKL